MLIKFAPLLRGLWWISTTWLLLTAFGLIYFILHWFFDHASPIRHEALIAGFWLVFYSWPALLGIFLASILPTTGLSPTKRIAGVGLLGAVISGTYFMGYLPG